MIGQIAALYRHPVKGFTPEPVDAVVLTAGGHFPCDRLYSVENGASGFDPAAPAHISKMKFAVLARIPELARARTRFDAATGRLTVQAEGLAPFEGGLGDEAGRAAFAAWLAAFLAVHAPEDHFGPLTVLAAPDGHRFMDSRNGFVSILNLASVRDLEQQLGRPIDPARFRANVLVEGWPAWAEYGLAGRSITLGGAALTVLDDIDRCVATHVDPQTGVRDIEVVPALHSHYGHVCCGVYAAISQGGPVSVGDAAAA